MQLAVAILALLLTSLFALLVSSEPAVPARQRPTAETLRAADEAIDQIQNRTSRRTRLQLSNRALAAAAVLAGDTTRLGRLQAGVENGVFSAIVSMPLPAGLWLNGSVAVAGAHRGFPPLYVRAGNIPLPRWAGRRLAELAHSLLRLRGADLPPLDQMVRSVAVGRDSLTAELELPLRTGVVGGLVRLQGKRVDEDRVAAIYCRLAAQQRQRPTSDLASQVRRAFAGPAQTEPAEYNRSAFVALAMLAVGDRAYDLARGALPKIRACGGLQWPVLLAGRADLAKHWTLSAALTALLGTDTAGAMGEWKELDDSLPDGSGFSFVDLAADRSGLHLARRASDPATAGEAAAALAKASEPELFPIALLAAHEGMSEGEFLARYRKVDSRRYDATIRWIDRTLASRTAG